MQINIDKKTGTLLGIIGFLLIAVIALAVPKLHSNDSDHYSGMNSHHSSGSMMGKSSGSLTGNELMFFQMMVPHHQQAVDISELALKVSKDSELRNLAQQIKSGQEVEIKAMKSWVSESGSSLTDQHMMHEMGGMLSDQELAKLQTLSGKAFDIYWLEKMIAHHEGAIHMALMIQDSSVMEYSQLAQDIKNVQTEQITQMKKMLKRLGA